MTRVTRYRLAATTVIFITAAATFAMIWADRPAGSQTNPTPGIGSTAVTLIDTAGPGTTDDREIRIRWLYQVTDTTGLPQATLEFEDRGVNYGNAPLPGIVNGGADRIPNPGPLHVFTHGTAGDGHQNVTMMRDIVAEHGGIAVLVTHTRHSLVQVARRQLCRDNPTCTPGSEELDGFQATALNRHADLRFAITMTDAIFSSSGKVLHDAPGDPTTVVIGHSQGAMSTLMLASGLNRPGPTWNPTLYGPDPRVDALIPIAPSRYLTVIAGWGDTPTNPELDMLTASITQPVLILQGTADGVTPPQYAEHITRALTNTWFTSARYVPDAEHNATTDLLDLKPHVDSSTLPSDVKQLVSDLTDQMCASSTTACVSAMHDQQLQQTRRFLDAALP
jgi:pimeloyl-ACP methyl ester carboxylesterase